MDSKSLANEFTDCFESLQTERLFKRLKLTYKGENVILFLLDSNGGSSTPGNLCEKVDFTAARLSAIIKSLESKGFVKKEQNEQDKRSSIIFITDEGRAHLRGKKQEITANAFTIAEQLGEKDVKELIRIINRLAVIANSMEDI